MNEDEDRAAAIIPAVAITLHVAVLHHLRRIGLLDDDAETMLLNQALYSLPEANQDAGAVILRQVRAGLHADIPARPQD